MKRIRELALATVLFLAPIAAALAADTMVYKDPTGSILRIHDEPCAAPGAAQLLLDRGVPPKAVAGAARTTLHLTQHEVRNHEGCWVSGYHLGVPVVVSVAPTIGDGIFQVAMELFEEDDPI